MRKIRNITKLLKILLIVTIITMAIFDQNNVSAVSLKEETHVTHFTTNEIEIFYFGIEDIGVSITESTEVTVRYVIKYPEYVKRGSSVPMTIEIQDITAVWHLRVNGYDLITRETSLRLGEENTAFIAGLPLTPISSQVNIDISAVFSNPTLELLVKDSKGAQTVYLTTNSKTFYVSSTNSGVSLKIKPTLKMTQSFRLTVYLLLLSKNFDFRPTPVSMPGDSYITVNIPPAPLLKISSNPSGGSVYIDESFVGSTPTTLEITPGTHNVAIRKEDYKEFKKTIIANPGDVIELNANLEALYGLLTVTTEPEGANVFVDGKYLGSSPIKDLKLQPGTHSLRVVKEGYIETTKNVTIVAGRTTTITITLQKAKDSTKAKNAADVGGICGPGVIVLLSSIAGIIAKRRRK